MLFRYFKINVHARVFIPIHFFQYCLKLFFSLSTGPHFFIVPLQCLSNVYIPQDTGTIKGLNVLAKLWLMQCLSDRHNTIKLNIERVVN